MTDRERCRLALSVLAGSIRRLDAAAIAALELEQHPDSTTSFLSTGEKDFAWHGDVASGPLKGQPLQVPAETLKECAVNVVMEYMNRVGAFKRARKVVNK